jgi:photosystem II stability/assembly factor-like uncharacterized protein
VVRWALEGKHVSALVREPSRDVLFAGTHGQGLYASEDNGQTWELRVRGLVSEHIYSMNVAVAKDEVRLYAGTEPANLHVSIDMGATWRVLPAIRLATSVGSWKFPAPPHQAHLKNIGFDPRKPDTIYASVEVGALLKSTDAGATWRELPVPYEDVHRVAIHESAPDHVYIATGKGIYHSLDAGESWEGLTDQSTRVGYPDALIVHPDQPSLMFTAGAVIWPREWPNRGSADPRIMRSRDAGRTWEVVDNGLPEHLHGNIEAMAMTVWPEGFALFAGTTDGEVFASEDGGENWAVITFGLPAVSKTSHYQMLQRLREGNAAEAASRIRV